MFAVFSRAWAAIRPVFSEFTLSAREIQKSTASGYVARRIWLKTADSLAF